VSGPQTKSNQKLIGPQKSGGKTITLRKHDEPNGFVGYVVAGNCFRGALAGD